VIVVFAAIFLGLWLFELIKNKKLTQQFFDVSLKLKGYEVENLALHEMEKTFKGLSQEVLDRNTEQMIKTAVDKQEQLVAVLQPVKETLDKLTTGLQGLEKERKGDHEGLKTQLKLLKDSEILLKEQTHALVSALKNPVCRGMWGEMQLKRVLEISGLLPHCDFIEQQVLKTDRLRPDVIVKLAGGRELVIDAKAPLESYLEAASLTDETLKEEKLKHHALKLKEHIVALSKKSYFEALDHSIEFVILFLPQESLFSAALAIDPTLIELAAKHQVMIATPTTLLALLKAVAFGWKQETLCIQVDQIKTLGKELYKRVGDLNTHFARLGKGLNSAVEAYNKTLGTLESRVIVTLRKFDSLGIDTIETKYAETQSLTELAKEPTVEA
jgi:DNA recombination protein RmuC